MFSAGISEISGRLGAGGVLDSDLTPADFAFSFEGVGVGIDGVGGGGGGGGGGAVLV